MITHGCIENFYFNQKEQSEKIRIIANNEGNVSSSNQIWRQSGAALSLYRNEIHRKWHLKNLSNACESRNDKGFALWSSVLS